MAAWSLAVLPLYRSLLPSGTNLQPRIVDAAELDVVVGRRRRPPRPPAWTRRGVELDGNLNRGDDEDDANGDANTKVQQAEAPDGVKLQYTENKFIERRILVVFL